MSEANELTPWHELELYKVDFDKRGYENDYVPGDLDQPGNANVVGSKIKGTEEHWLIADVDVPAVLIPSSTPGHSHLYVKARLSYEALNALLTALSQAGIVDPAWVDASRTRNQPMLRLPWVKKPGLEEKHDREPEPDPY